MTSTCLPSEPEHHVTRRQFLRTLGVATAGIAVAGCLSNVLPAPVAAPVQVAPLATVPASAHPVVAIAQAAGYDHVLVRRQVQTLLDELGGWKDLIHPGVRVAVKVNLTGGARTRPLPGVAPVESFATHPEVVRALCELLVDAGSGALTIVEAVYEWESYSAWGYEEIARPLNARLLDLNSPDPYEDFVSLPVGQGWLSYDAFTVNRVLAETDVFVSVAKMKCHATCGVTHAMKNLVGTVPAKAYESQPGDGYRTAFHVQSSGSNARLPRIVVDLNRARPIHLALIDGIKTMEGGEGPWCQDGAPIAPGLLIAGRNAVATDAVATALQGFDPTSDYPETPFLHAENHLNLARASGLGTNRLDEIQVVGPAIADVQRPFRPAA